MEHPFFAEFHDPEDEPVADALHPYDFDFELYDLTADQLMDLLYDEIMLYHDESLLDKYIEDRMLHPEGCVGIRFGLSKTGYAIKEPQLHHGGGSGLENVSEFATEIGQQMAISAAA